MIKETIGALGAAVLGVSLLGAPATAATTAQVPASAPSVTNYGGGWDDWDCWDDEWEGWGGRWHDRRGCRGEGRWHKRDRYENHHSNRSLRNKQQKLQQQQSQNVNVIIKYSKKKKHR